MKIIGIIAEYNPFHNGHEYQLKKCRELYPDCKMIILMSGNFTQRAQPAVFDKWIRAYSALMGGADLVLELPFLYAISSAESFARGAIRLLNALNCVDILIFGSEDNFEYLKSAAEILNNESEEYKLMLKENLNKGFSFAQSRQYALEKMHSFPSEILSKPNNILAIEYLKALKRFKCEIEPQNILRQGSAHCDNNLNDFYSSAGALRKELKSNGLTEKFFGNVPDSCKSIYNDSDSFSDLNIFFRLILAKIRTMTAKQISSISEVSEGAEYRILNATQHARTYEELVDEIQTRRYTYSRVRRILINCLFGITHKIASRAHKDELYARVLAAKKDSGLLSLISKVSAIPLIVKSKDFISCELLKFDFLASEIYGVITPVVKDSLMDFTHMPYII